MDTGVTLQAMTKIIARIESEMKKPVAVNAYTVCLTASIGAAVISDDGGNAAELISVAEDRVYSKMRLRQGCSFQVNFVPSVPAIDGFAKI